MGGFLERIPQLLRVGVITGLVAGIVLGPAAIVAGNTVKAGAARIRSVPSELIETPAGQTSYVYGSDGQTLLTMFYEEHRKHVPISELPPHLYQAVVAAEDSRFFHHNGVDLKGLVRAFIANQQAGEVSQGASTLTMQYVRMALRDSAATPREVIEATEQTTSRKIREVRMAIELENRLTKEEILERYLNTAYFGHRAYGAFAAAQIYFSKEPKQLTVGEAALLAGLVKAPTAYDPASNDAVAAKDRRDWVLAQMGEQKYITPEAAAAAQAEPVALTVSDPPNDCVSSQQNWGFFCDFFKNWWIRQSAFGANPQERMDRLRRGGFKIVTSIDPAVQAIAQREIDAKESVGSVFAHGVVVVEPGTGRVKAMAVNRNYAVDQSGNGPHTGGRPVPGNYPNTVAPLLGGGELPGYQAGSTFKFFTLLAALNGGFPLNTTFHAPQRLVSAYPGTPGAPSTCGDRWCPVNASEAMTGTHTMWSGFGKSVNTYFVQLEQAVGAQWAVDMAQKLGLQWRSETDKKLASTPELASTWGSFTLGTADTTPLEMANAMATVAAEGLYCAPLPLLSITDPDGVPVGDAASPKCEQVIPQWVARAATDAARCVTGYGAAGGDCGDWSTAGGVYGQVGRPVAGKTGTTDDTRAAWFVGYTPQLAAASFIADPDNPFNVVGDWQSQKPVNTVSGVLRDALASQPVAYFNFP